MHYTSEDIKQLDKVTRLKIINSVTGIKPANLLGTIDKKGRTNLAVFSSIIHLGSNPALLGFIVRPTGEVPRHTYENIKENGVYTINHIHPKFTENAHYTSAKFDESTSEFERCGFTEEFIADFKAPFVKESTFKMGMNFKDAIPIPLNGTIMVIGEIEHLVYPDDAMVADDIDLEVSNSVGISGLNSYYALKKIGKYPYARVNETPDF
ncbi:flavin reductase family protein [Flagellimonas sp. HMM57]|uniref:flavin reductase family protein n=1 Tax=unclassified Flagellimonas TaxID=2644544 RepID=UPI0013D6EF62|nr:MULTISPECIES: flavin reductase [unclassified Flagellimonas]UII75655.1 flavin reductase family protein [Flagellimonas sp. HMM57]